MRGLFDWKVIVALLIALLVASTALGSTGGVREFLEKGWNKLRSLLSGSPIPIPSLGGSAVPIKLVLESPVALTPDRAVDVSIGDVQLRQFKGSLTVDRANKTLRLQQNGLELVAPLRSAAFADFSIASFSASGVAFTILPNVTTSNGSIEFKNFHGSVSVSEMGALVEGNVTSLRTSIGGREWELK